MDKKVHLTLSGLLLAILIFSGGILAAENSEDKSTPDRVSESTLKKHDPAFIISIESIKKRLRENQETLLIDVRSRTDFEKVRI